MEILKNTRNNRFFIATPALLKCKNMIPATEAEKEEFLSTLNEEKAEAFKEDVKVKEATLSMPSEDFDVNVDVSKFGKPQLLKVAMAINLAIPASLRVKEIRPLVEEALEKLRAEQTVEEPQDEIPPSGEGDLESGQEGEGA